MEVSIVEFFQGLSCGFLDIFFWIITQLGEETFFLFVLMISYLCYSKKFAVKLTLFYLSSVAFNNFIKVIVRRPRPYLESSSIKNRLNADGYSFPSGHTQGYFAIATTNFIEINKKHKSAKVKLSTLIVLSIVGILVMISRMYWGQHFLSDVVVGMMFGISAIFFMDWILSILSSKIKEWFTIDRIYLWLGVFSGVLFVIMLLLDLVGGVSFDLIYKFSAVFVAMSIGYFVDKKFILYKSNQGCKIGIIKAMIMVVAVSMLYVLIDLIFDVSSFVVFIVYLFLGLVCTIILPMIFKKIFKSKVNNEYC